MGILTFIIDNILINAAMVLGIVALLGLILQKKSAGACFSGTFKTMMGFMILSAGSGVIVGALEPFGTWFAAGLGIQGSVASIEAVLAVAMQNDMIGRDCIGIRRHFCGKPGYCAADQMEVCIP